MRTKSGFVSDMKLPKNFLDLNPGDDVRVSDLRKKGELSDKRKLPEPRSYLVELESGAQLTKNRMHLKTLLLHV